MDTEARSGTTGSMGTMGTPAMWITLFLTMGWLLGAIGSFLDEESKGQIILYSLAAMGGTGAGALLAVRHTRAGRDLAAAGFLAIAGWSLANSVFGYTGDPAAVVGASMAVLLLPGMLLIASQDWSAMWTRAAAALSGVAFAIWGYQWILGDMAKAPDLEAPILMAAYGLFTVAAIGWTLTVRSEG